MRTVILARRFAGPAAGTTSVQCLIWEAFAQFGVGVGASGTATSSGVVIVEDFTVPATCP